MLLLTRIVVKTAILLLFAVSSVLRRAVRKCLFTGLMLTFFQVLTCHAPIVVDSFCHYGSHTGIRILANLGLMILVIRNDFCRDVAWTTNLIIERVSLAKTLHLMSGTGSLALLKVRLISSGNETKLFLFHF